MNELEKAIVVAFPLRGEWLVPNTPGKKIPSHGTNQLGSRYAYDFIQVDWNRKGLPSYDVHWLYYLVFGVPLQKCYCFGQNIYAPCDGVIVTANDGCKERKRVHLLSDLLIAVKNAHFFRPQTDNLQCIAGNYIVMKCSSNVYAGFVHLQKGSISVCAGQTIKKGDLLGNIGHSGNSLFPHLHFQLMDSSDILTAKGLPCAFAAYESFRNGTWEQVYSQIPTDTEHIRFDS